MHTQGRVKLRVAAPIVFRQNGATSSAGEATSNGGGTMTTFGEDRQFLRVDLGVGEYTMLSRPACILALYAAAASLRNNTPGFIADARLGPDTTLAVIELVLCGLWRRVDGGYEITAL